jgi:hypothetical protein
MVGGWFKGAVLLVAVTSCTGLPGPPGPPPMQSQLALQVVTYACVPLRGEFTVDGTTYVRGLSLEPTCPSPEQLTSDCYRPSTEQPRCPFSCPELTYWKGVNGTAPMHRFSFSIEDDGSHSGALGVTIHLTLSTLDDTLIWEGDQSEDLTPLLDHRAGYFHSGLMEMRLDEIVWRVLGKNCV